MNTIGHGARLNLMRLALLGAILIVWQLASGVVVSEFFISKPSAIAKALVSLVTDGNLFFHMGITATEAFAGFIIGATGGIVTGVLLGRIHILAELLHPFIL